MWSRKWILVLLFYTFEQIRAVRYYSLERIEKFIKMSHEVTNSVEMLLRVNKKVLKEAYRRFRGKEKISGTDDSCINEIYSQLRKRHKNG